MLPSPLFCASADGSADRAVASTDTHAGLSQNLVTLQSFAQIALAVEVELATAWVSLVVNLQSTSCSVALRLCQAVSFDIVPLLFAACVVAIFTQTVEIGNLFPVLFMPLDPTIAFILAPLVQSTLQPAQFTPAIAAHAVMLLDPFEVSHGAALFGTPKQ